MFELLIRQPKQVLDDFQETNSLTGLFGGLYPSWYSRPKEFLINLGEDMFVEMSRPVCNFVFSPDCRSFTGENSASC